jgi:hypothetical protein
MATPATEFRPWRRRLRPAAIAACLASGILAAATGISLPNAAHTLLRMPGDTSSRVAGGQSAAAPETHSTSAHADDAAVLAADPELAAALSAIADAGAAGVDVLAPPPPATPDWNQLAAAETHATLTRRHYQAPGGGTATLASWSFGDGEHSGHLAVTGANMASDNSASLGLNAGATVKPGPVQLDFGLNGNDSGAWSGRVSSQMSVGKVQLTAASNYGATLGTPTDSGQLGYSLSASSSLTDQLSVNGALSWTRADLSLTDSRGYHGAVHLSHDLGRDLRLSSEMGVSASGDDSWGLQPQAYAMTGLNWTPRGGAAVSASITDQAGAFSLATAARAPFY